MEAKQVRDLMEAYASVYANISESHFKVGDEVVCKASGMEGEIVKVDSEGKGKYYTVKCEDGKTKKYSPDELKLDKEEEKEEGASKEKEGEFHDKLDKMVHKTFGKRPEEKKMKEEFEFWVNQLVEEGCDLSDYTWDEMYGFYLDEARRADKEGYERGTSANPTNRNIPTGDPSQRSILHLKIKRRADEMGRERRGSAAYRAGRRPQVSKKEKAFLRASDRTRQSVSNPPVPDTGRHAGVSRYDREDSSKPKRNPKHNANKETAAESFDLFDVILEHLVAEGYADTNKAALAIMANMSEEWKQSIVEVLDTPERANEYAKKNVRSMLGAFAKGVVNKDSSQLKTIEKRKRGAEMGKRKAERKAAEEES